MKKFMGVLFLLFFVLGVNASAMTIGYYDATREEWGFDGNSYLTQAKQYLIDQGHTLVNTAYADDAFLGTVDAFFTGLITTVDSTEIAAMESFVNDDGGFLFIQQDHSSGNWFSAANSILANWGISVEGTYSNDTGHYTVGDSAWVTDPYDVDSFIGSAHSVIVAEGEGFEVLGYDDLQRAILGVYDAGEGRSSDVLIATDINFWDDYYGWANESNRQLWANIWQSVEDDVDDDNTVPEPGTMFLLGAGLVAAAGIRRKLNQD